MKVNQTYLNIGAGVLISALGSVIVMGIGWAAKIQVTINKADYALREIERNEKEMMRKNIVYHKRLSKNEKDIKANGKIALEAAVRSEINMELYMKEH